MGLPGSEAEEYKGILGPSKSRQGIQVQRGMGDLHIEGGEGQCQGKLSVGKREGWRADPRQRQEGCAYMPVPVHWHQLPEACGFIHGAHRPPPGTSMNFKPILLLGQCLNLQLQQEQVSSGNLLALNVSLLISRIAWPGNY